MEPEKISSLEKEIEELKLLLSEKERELSVLKIKKDVTPEVRDQLSQVDIERFSRQIIIPSIGCAGQVSIKKSNILIVGTGGLGCPASQYLAGAGVGVIGLIDYDSVEVSNLHRQLLHSECTIGIPKVSSAAAALKRLNSNVKVEEHCTQIDSFNALTIIQKYDVVIDASDNVATRYLLNDACVLLNKPLVSGSALRLEGQLTVYNYCGGPCYRCMFPKPPPPETVTNCGDGGVLGMVPGVIGVLQALEAIKIVLNWPGVLSGHLLLFSAETSTFRNIQLRPKNTGCAVCGDKPTVTHLTDYEVFCGAKATDKDSALKLLPQEQRVSPETLQRSFICNKEGVLIDVRDPEEFKMCALPGSLNIPLKKIEDPSSIKLITTKLQEVQKEQNHQVYIVCRRGNDSQKAVVKLQQILRDKHVTVCDLEGGLHAWSRKVDPTFPIY